MKGFCELCRVGYLDVNVMNVLSVMVIAIALRNVFVTYKLFGSSAFPPFRGLFRPLIAVTIWDQNEYSIIPP